MSILAAGAQQIIVQPAKSTPWWTIILTQIGVILGAIVATAGAVAVAVLNQREQRRQRLRDRRIDAAAAYAEQIDRFRSCVVDVTGGMPPEEAYDALFRAVFSADEKRTFIRLLFEEDSKPRMAAHALHSAMAQVHDAARVVVRGLNSGEGDPTQAFAELSGAMNAMSDRAHEFVGAAGDDLARP